MTRPLICLAHRGASGHAPENTLAAFNKAVELGADWVELDVYAVENELVVIHDERLERTTNGTGRVHHHDLAYLRGLDAGQGQKIPLLSEVFDTINRRVKINIELKGPHTAGPAVDLINRYVAGRGWQYNQFLLSSFTHDRIRRARRLAPEIPIAPNISGNSRMPEAILGEAENFYSVHLESSLVSPDRIREIHRQGALVFVFTVNQTDKIKKMYSQGADGIFTNFPERVIQLRLS